MEVVYSPEMSDADLEKFLGKFAHKIADAFASVVSRSAAPAPVVSNSFFQRYQSAIAIIGSSVGVIVALLLGMTYIVESSVTKALMEPNKQLATLVEQQSGLRRDLDRVTTKVFLATATLSPSSPADIKSAAKNALAAKIVVDSKSIEKVSESLFKNVDQEKWEAATALLNLRSFGNSTLEEAKRHVGLVYDVNLRGNWVGSGRPGSWLLIEGPGDLRLDGNDGDSATVYGMSDGKRVPLRIFPYVIFRNMHILYGGGAVTLVDAFFDNCTFSISRDRNGTELAQSLMKNNTLSVSLGR